MLLPKTVGLKLSILVDCFHKFLKRARLLLGCERPTMTE